MKKQTLILAIIPVLIATFAVSFYAIGWTEPTSAPPAGNIDLPLNTGPTGQSKEGGIVLNTGGATNALVIDQGNLCFDSDCKDSWPSGVEPTYGGTYKTCGADCATPNPKTGACSCPAGFSTSSYTVLARWVSDGCTKFDVGTWLSEVSVVNCYK